MARLSSSNSSRSGWRSLRFRAVGVVTLVIAAPVLSVWFSDLADVASGWQMERRVSHAAHEVAQNPAQIREIAWLWGVRARVLSPEGAILREAGRGSRLRSTVFFGPGGGPTLEGWDAAQPPLPLRPEVQAARTQGAVSGCFSAEERQLLVCYAAAQGAEGRVIYVVDGSRRAIQALYAVRYPLLKLALLVALPGMMLGWWLGWRMVWPVEHLRAQVLERQQRRSLAPIQLDRGDEFGDLARAFNALLGDLAARSVANEAFAADLAHELKNPLAAIAAVAEVLEQGQPVDVVRAARLARALRSSGGRLEILVHRFLELARAEAGLAQAPRESVDLLALGRGVIEGMAVDPRLAQVRFVVQGDGEAPTVQGVSERLETALRNLLDNAATFAAQQHPDGGGEVILRTRVSPEEVRLEVVDNGPGVPEADRERLFERFFSRRKGGTGLGLALTRAIVEAHGGRITLSTGAGAGACFGLYIPRDDPQRNPENTEQQRLR